MYTDLIHKGIDHHVSEHSASAKLEIKLSAFACELFVNA